ncbi:MAG: glycine zipper domain-containing protein [Planctomycetota bacterium]
MTRRTALTPTTRRLGVLAALLAFVPLTGCAHDRHTGALIGAAVGAGIGYVIATEIDDHPKKKKGYGHGHGHYHHPPPRRGPYCP